MSVMVLAGFTRRDATGARCVRRDGDKIMSLNWDLSECADSEALRSEERWPFTENLIFTTMAVDMGCITEKNIEQFAARIEAYGKVFGALFQRFEDGQFVGRVITVEELRPYIGLRTNVTTTSDTAFRNRLSKALMEKAGKAVS